MMFDLSLLSSRFASKTSSFVDASELASFFSRSQLSTFFRYSVVSSPVVKDFLCSSFFDTRILVDVSGQV